MAGIDSGHVMAESDTAADGLERKLATILSADVAAYSRLMAEDEERTLQTFRAHKEVFEKLVQLHRGRVFNTAGDAILAESGAERRRGPNRAWSVTCPVGCCTSSAGIMARVWHKPRHNPSAIAKLGGDITETMVVGTAAMYTRPN
jgi:class 3 adenylate cyclase